MGCVRCMCVCSMKVKKNLQETQSKVEDSKAEIIRINNELTPMEVGVWW